MRMSFGRVIRKYERDFEVTRNPDASIVDGRLSKGNSRVEILPLALFPLRSEQLQDYESGTYTTQDRKIYQREGSIMSLQENDVVYDSRNGSYYEIRELTSWEAYADFSTFIAKKVVVEND